MLFFKCSNYIGNYAAQMTIQYEEHYHNRITTTATITTTIIIIKMLVVIIMIIIIIIYYILIPGILGFPDYEGPRHPGFSKSRNSRKLGITGVPEYPES